LFCQENEGEMRLSSAERRVKCRVQSEERRVQREVQRAERRVQSEDFNIKFLHSALCVLNSALKTNP
jgi:hypothetical protein